MHLNYMIIETTANHANGFSWVIFLEMSRNLDQVSFEKKKEFSKSTELHEENGCYYHRDLTHGSCWSGNLCQYTMWSSFFVGIC